MRCVDDLDGDIAMEAVRWCGEKRIPNALPSIIRYVKKIPDKNHIDSGHRSYSGVCYGLDAVAMIGGRNALLKLSHEINDPDVKAEIIVRLKDVDSLREQLKSDDPNLRRKAGWGLVETKDEKCLPDLVALMNDTDKDVRISAMFQVQHLLVGNKSTENIPLDAYVDKINNSQDLEEQDLAAALIGNFVRNFPETATRIKPVAYESLKTGWVRNKGKRDPKHWDSFAVALAELGDIEQFPAMIEILSHKNWSVRSDGVVALRFIGDERAIPALIELLENESTGKMLPQDGNSYNEHNSRLVQAEIGETLGALAAKTKSDELRQVVVDELIKQLNCNLSKMLEEAKLVDESYFSIIHFRLGNDSMRTFQDGRRILIIALVKALGRTGGGKAMEQLIKIRGDASLHEDVRKAVEGALSGDTMKKEEK